MKQFFLTLAITGSLLSGLHSETIPLHLPRPDGKPGKGAPMGGRTETPAYRTVIADA